jgi:SAM-dependent methyltransferase
VDRDPAAEVRVSDARSAARRGRFRERQQRFFHEADEGHFRWQTESAYFAKTERDLLGGFPLAAGAAVLEVGCGEGGNLLNLLRTAPSAPGVVVGVDLFERKLAFASRQGIAARFVCGDALGLPLRDEAFDVILCRDVLHHLDDPSQALRELRRVAKPEATVWIVEPNGRNPLISLLALVRPHERGQMRNSVASLRDLAARHFPRVDIEVRQPLPLHRVVLHHKLGISALDRCAIVAGLLDAWDRLFRVIWPRRLWAYIVVKTERTTPSTADDAGWRDATPKI